MLQSRVEAKPDSVVQSSVSDNLHGAMTAPADFFPDLRLLLEQSRPQASRTRAWRAGALFISMMLVGAWLGGRSNAIGPAVHVLSALIMLGLIAAMLSLSYATVRRTRREQAELVSAEEWIRLRRWPQAAAALRALLSEPMHSEIGRTSALLMLSAVLARYDARDNALALQGALLDEKQLDPYSETGVRLSRAHLLLREDRLFDADRAITELRRVIRRLNQPARPAADAEDSAEAAELAEATPLPPGGPGAVLLAGLTLLEIYRDVKTGHPQDALEIFAKSWPLMQAQLGHRASEALVLAACASAMIGQNDSAATHYRNATLLTPLTELQRRYPEVSALRERFTPAAAPREAA